MSVSLESEEYSSPSDEDPISDLPKLQWIYELRKPELKSILEQFSLPREGKVRDLRKRLRQFFLENTQLWRVSSNIMADQEAKVGPVSKTMPPTNIYAPPVPIMPPFSSFPYTYSSLFDIKFDNTSSCSADDFLLAINERRQMYSIPDNTMLLSLPQVFVGTPLTWYRLNKTNWTTWNDFEKEFKQTFFPHDFVQKLKKEIDRRTQGEEEDISTFIINLQYLMSRLPNPMSAEEQLSALYNNLLPRYQFHIRFSEVKSISDLLLRGREYEQIEERAKSFRPPPPKDKSLYPETAYQGPTLRRPNIKLHYKPVSSIQDETVITPTSTHTISTKPTQRPRSSGSKSHPVATTSLKPKCICWNCKEEGHGYPDCKKPPQHLFCYHCGTSGVTYKTCSTCSKQGNEKRGRE